MVGSIPPNMRPRITGGFRFGAIKKDNNTQSDFKINKVKAKPKQKEGRARKSDTSDIFQFILGQIKEELKELKEFEKEDDIDVSKALEMCQEKIKSIMNIKL